jgi:hypothetical protein
LGLSIVALAASVFSATSAQAGLIDFAEQIPWSDLSYPNIDSGDFDIDTQTLTINTTEASFLELGAQYGPPPASSGHHYGSSGSLGATIITTLSVSGVQLDANGNVINDGGEVKVTFNGPPANGTNFASHYGVVNGSVLLLGKVLQAKLDPTGTGADTMNILFSIDSGELQEPNSQNGLVFAPAALGMLHIGGITLPASFSADFDFSDGSLDLYGIPEPGSLALGALAAIFGAPGCLRRRCLRTGYEAKRM